MLSEEQANILRLLVNDAIEANKLIRRIYEDLLKKCKGCKEFTCDNCTVNELLNLIASELMN